MRPLEPGPGAGIIQESLAGEEAAARAGCQADRLCCCVSCSGTAGPRLRPRPRTGLPGGGGECEWVDGDTKEARPLRPTWMLCDPHLPQWWPEPSGHCPLRLSMKRETAVCDVSGGKASQGWKAFCKADWGAGWRTGPRAARRRATAQPPGTGIARRQGVRTAGVPGPSPAPCPPLGT